MSVWYSITIEAMGDRSAIAKLMNLPKEDVVTDNVTLSFGGKNGPGLGVMTLVENNPDLIFLVQCNIECETVQYWITRFDLVSNKHQFIMVQDIGPWNNEINKKILEQYTQKYPSLPEKHFANMEPENFDPFRWKLFFNDFNRMAEMLHNEEQYKEMLCVAKKEDCDLDFDNQPLDE